MEVVTHERETTEPAEAVDVTEVEIREAQTRALRDLGRAGEAGTHLVAVGETLRNLQAAELSTVVLDADGNIIGGGYGYGGAYLPPAARVFFKIDNGMRPIPFYKAASALVSVVPTYAQNP